MSAAQKLY